MSSRRRAWRAVPLLIIVFLASGELAARFDDLARYDVSFLAVPDHVYDLVVFDSGTIRGRPFGRYEKIRLNAAGFRGPPIAPFPPAGCIRVTVLGASESIVGGEQAGTEYPAFMQRELARYGCFEVQNAAVSGLTLPRITRLWTDWAAKFPAQVVVVYPSPAFYLRPDPPDYPAWPLRPIPKPAWWTPRLALRLSDQSFWPDRLAAWRLRRYIKQKVARHGRGWEYDRVPPDRLALYERHLDSLVVAIQATGAEPALVTHANRFPTPPTQEDEPLLLAWQQDSRATAEVILEFERAANAAMIAVAKQRGAIVVDAAARLGGHREWFTDFAHFTTAGRAVLGALVADSVRALVERRLATGSAPSHGGP